MNLLKTIFSIIPSRHANALRMNFLLSVIGLVLDFVSIVVLVPVFAGLFDGTKAAAFQDHFPDVIRQNPVAFVISVALFFVLKNIISARISKIQTSFYYHVANDLSVSLLKNYFDKTLQEVKSGKNSSLIKDIIFMPNNFVAYVLSSVMQLFSETLLLLFILITSFLINPKVMLFLFGLSAIIILGFFFYEKNKLENINRGFARLYDHNFSNLTNAVNGYADIKTSRAENYFIEKFSQSNTALNQVHCALTVDRIVKPRHTEIFLILVISGLYLLSGYFSSQYDLLFVSFLLAACIKIVPSVNRILTSITNLKANMHTVDVLKKNQSAPTFVKTQQPIVFENSISINDVRFTFGTAALIDGVSLEIPKGKIIGIFGNSGSGKSTLANIIATLIKPETGQLFCDGVQITDANSDAYLSLIAYVSQAPFLIEGNIIENLYLDGKVTDRTRLDDYLEVFSLKETIAEMPLGLNTFVGSNGFALSGGQIQRLAIIRALLRQPEILILDEAANQIQATLRASIMSSLRKISEKQNLTIISISHNPQELANFCDVVYELKNSLLIPVR